MFESHFNFTTSWQRKLKAPEIMHKTGFLHISGNINIIVFILLEKRHARSHNKLWNDLFITCFFHLSILFPIEVKDVFKGLFSCITCLSVSGPRTMVNLPICIPSSPLTILQLSLAHYRDQSLPSPIPRQAHQLAHSATCCSCSRLFPAARRPNKIIPIHIHPRQAALPATHPV